MSSAWALLPHQVRAQMLVHRKHPCIELTHSGPEPSTPIDLPMHAIIISAVGDSLANDVMSYD